VRTSLHYPCCYHALFLGIVFIKIDYPSLCNKETLFIVPEPPSRPQETETTVYQNLSNPFIKLLQFFNAQKIAPRDLAPRFPIYAELNKSNNNSAVYKAVEILYQAFLTYIYLARQNISRRCRWTWRKRTR
jgi:hypothetical protein